ncbi:MAG TPA: hypothetical protein VFY89_08365 [Ktedonobacterales bacterium]
MKRASAEPIPVTTEATASAWHWLLPLLPRLVAGAALVGSSTWLGWLTTGGWQPIGPLVGIVLVVFSLFGDLPAWISWTQRLGTWLFPGVAVGTVALLVPFLLPQGARESSFLAFSPAVWLAYISIVLVGISFEMSELPRRVYRLCQRLPAGPAVVIPCYVIIAGLLGNILDGVSIMAISVVILLSLLPLVWAIRASFALLFGGLISNLITVAAEPTNIKFQDVLAPLLNRVSPSYWFTNWPICVLGIVLPAAALGVLMARERVTWRVREPAEDPLFGHETKTQREAAWLGILAPVLLAGGIVAHATLITVGHGSGGSALDLPLWLLLVPAGLVAIWHLGAIGYRGETVRRLLAESPVWLRLMVIFSLLWFLSNALASAPSVLASFFTWPQSVRYGVMVVLSLLSSITDNVALAAMQGSLLLHHPLAIWQVRLLFILLTWAGGFTPFGCLQSLAVNSRLRLSVGAWFREARLWGLLALVGGLAGLAALMALYPTTTGLPR